jgi:hypothetical protein
MKVFQFIHAMLLLALVIGVPIAATTRGPQEGFSPGRALAQAGLAAAVLLVLLVINLGLGRLWAKSRHRKGKP